MHITTPAEIPFVIWQGELVAHTGRLIPSTSVPPVVALGQMEAWPVRDVLEIPDHGHWAPPDPEKAYWLLRQGFYLRQQSRVSNIMETQLTLYIRPDQAKDLTKVEAINVFPTMMNPDMPLKSIIALRSNLSFIGQAGLKPDEAHANIIYRRTFPIIRGYDAGTCTPHWIFKPQAQHALTGSQYIYTVIAVSSTVQRVDVIPELIVTVNTLRGPIRFGLPGAARARGRFKIPHSPHRAGEAREHHPSE